MNSSNKVKKIDANTQTNTKSNPKSPIKNENFTSNDILGMNKNHNAKTSQKNPLMVNNQLPELTKSLNKSISNIRSFNPQASKSKQKVTVLPKITMSIFPLVFSYLPKNKLITKYKYKLRNIKLQSLWFGEYANEKLHKAVELSNRIGIQAEKQPDSKVTAKNKKLEEQFKNKITKDPKVDSMIIAKEMLFLESSLTCLESQLEVRCQSIVTCIMSPYDYHRGSFIVSGHLDGRILAWVNDKVVFSHDIDDPSTRPIQKLKYFSDLDPSLFASMSIENSIKIWRMFTTDCLKTIWFTEKVLCIEPCLYSESLAVGLQNEGSIILVNINETNKRSSLVCHKDWVCALCYLKNDRQNAFIVSSSYDYNLYLFDLKTNKHVTNKRLDTLARSLVEISHDKIAAGCDDGSILIWDYLTANSRIVVNSHEGLLYSLIPYKGFLLSASPSSNSVKFILGDKIEKEVLLERPIGYIIDANIDNILLASCGLGRESSFFLFYRY